jgi:hypothetical protein
VLNYEKGLAYSSRCRYGREDEELMGLRFCNEVVIAAEQVKTSSNRFSLSLTLAQNKLECLSWQGILKGGSVIVPLTSFLTS